MLHRPQQRGLRHLSKLHKARKGNNDTTPRSAQHACHLLQSPSASGNLLYVSTSKPQDPLPRITRSATTWSCLAQARGSRSRSSRGVPPAAMKSSVPCNIRSGTPQHHFRWGGAPRNHGFKSALRERPPEERGSLRHALWPGATCLSLRSITATPRW